MESETIVMAIDVILDGIGKSLPGCLKAYYVAEAIRTDPEAFIEAMARLSVANGRLPCLRDIRADLGLEDTLAPRLSASALIAQIDHAIRRYGAYRQTEAKESMQPLAWKLVASLGGWESVCGKTDWGWAMERSYQLRLAEVLIREESMTKRLDERKQDETITLESATSASANAPAISEPQNSSYNEGRSHGRMR